MSIAEARRKANQLHVPSIDEDPAERKRILNVLAQRRYRRRKKDLIKGLEQTITEQGTSSTVSILSPLATHSAEAISIHIDKTTSDQFSNPPNHDTMTDFDHLLTCVNDMVRGQECFDTPCIESNSLAMFDTTFPLSLSSVPTSPSSMNSTTTTPSTITEASLLEQALAGDNTSLSRDEYHLPMFELNLLRGVLAIAKRLEVDMLIWSFDATSPTCGSSGLLSYSHLPLNLRPTSVQLSIPHHPVLDILPWPSVRDKLITVFAQLPDLRPPTARGPIAMLDLINDMEDPAEGIRIWGDDPYSDRSWEVGEKLFQNWWWALSSEVVARANEFRYNRGATILGAARVIQEIN